MEIRRKMKWDDFEVVEMKHLRHSVIEDSKNILI